MKRADLRRRRARVRVPAEAEASRPASGLVAKLSGSPSGLVGLSRVRTDGGTQPRASLDEATLTEYSERMALDASGGLVVDPEGRAWEEIVVFDDGESLWLADGFHRVESARRAGLEGIQARVEAGGLREAIRYSLGVNATHGKRRTRADKRRALERALRDEEWAQWADARVARMCKVTQPFVTKVRAELERDGEVAFQPVLYAADGRAFEREESPPAAPAAGRATTRAVPRRAALRRSVLGFEELSGASRAGLLVAYPVVESDWSALRDAADEAVDGAGALVALVPAESAWTFAGPAMLDALVESGRFSRAALVHATAPGRTFAVWHRSRADLPGVVSDPAEIAAALDLGEAKVVGQPLDRW